MRNFYYYNPEKLDLGKFRDDATKRARGDIRNPPEAVMIHHHSHDQTCEGREHEQFEPGKVDS